MDVEEGADKGGVVIDSTMEYCRNLGTRGHIIIWI